jgi:cytochrome c-type biogenesis protein CcmH
MLSATHSDAVDGRVEPGHDIGLRLWAFRVALSLPGFARQSIASALFALLLAGSAAAFQVDKPLPNPAQEARAQALGHEVRCLVCQNQSIADSNAELARDLRRIVRERIAAGDSDGQVLDYLVARYGDWVLLEPPFKASTLALWFGPPALLAAAALGAILWRRRQAGPAEAPLSEDERRRLAALIEREAP